MTSLRTALESFSTKGAGKKMAADLKAITDSAGGAVGSLGRLIKQSSTSNPFSAGLTVWQEQRQARVSSGGSIPGSRPITYPNGIVEDRGSRGTVFSRGGPAYTDSDTASNTGKKIAGAIGDTIKGALSNPLNLSSALGAVAFGGMSAMSSLAGSGIEYAYNRINGPQGNQAFALRASQALAPNVTMMRAASGNSNMTMTGMLRGLASRYPVMGTPDDMLSMILSGQSVGALMAGTPERNGFFESARQMQTLNPGASPGSIGSSLAGYMGNVRSQQLGAFLGQGAFTMVGQGGRYKSLSEWAEGITKFLEKQRLGGGQGKKFTAAELITQNFPGSNINAWFQMMGVPQDMVDFWWQYVLTARGSGGGENLDATGLIGATASQRGLNLGVERLKNVTQGSRREFLMGAGMYPLYGARESSDSRFNMIMQGLDAGLGSMFRDTNVGRMMALLPTPIMELLMPLMSQLATSPFGLASAGLAGALSSFGDPPIGDPIGDYGYAGGTSTAHLSPDLANRVKSMMRANPRLRVSSGYRDTVTQNRLRRSGYGMVAPSSRSKHTRGWAVDIGPTSEGGWLANNAHKFGLQSAASQGEPWHIQMAGTMPVGDDGNWLDKLKGWSTSAVGKVVGAGTSALGNLAAPLVEGLKWIMTQASNIILEPIQGIFTKLLSGGSFSKIVDTAVSLYSKLMMAPLSGLIRIGGESVSTGSMSEQDIIGLISGNETRPLPNITLPKGFSPKAFDVTDSGLFGDPSGLMASTPTSVSMNMGSPVVINAPITINGGSGSSGDARRVAAMVVDHLQSELSRRQWRTT
jgi:hypothetical protein